MSQQVWWYTVRATGLVAWVLVTASVVWGLMLSLRRIDAPRRRRWMLDLHRFLGGIAVLFVGAHVAALAFDSFVGFDWDDLFVPFASAWRPDAVAWGIVGAYLLLAVELSSLLMRHLRRWLWHAIHLLSLAVFVSVCAHALLAGADAEEPLVRAFAIGSSVTVSSLCVARLVLRRPRGRTPFPGPPPSVYAPAHAMGIPDGAGGRSATLVAPRVDRGVTTVGPGGLGGSVDDSLGLRSRGPVHGLVQASDRRRRRPVRRDLS